MPAKIKDNLPLKGQHNFKSLNWTEPASKNKQCSHFAWAAKADDCLKAEEKKQPDTSSSSDLLVTEPFWQFNASESYETTELALDARRKIAFR